jgi:hypothetical protein
MSKHQRTVGRSLVGLDQVRWVCICFSLRRESAGAPAPAEKWFTAPAVAAAVVTSIFTIAGIALKDYLFKWLEERRSDGRTQSAIYERYSHPLVTAAGSLLNRLYEILGRACERLFSSVKSQLENPFHFFDAIYCIDLDSAQDRWRSVMARFEALGIAARIRRFPAVPTPENRHNGCALCTGQYWKRRGGMG